MGYNVFHGITFYGPNPKEVKAAAAKTLETETFEARESEQILNLLAEGYGGFCGGKGWGWSIFRMGNYTDIGEVALDLVPFAKALQGEFHSRSPIVLFAQGEEVESVRIVKMHGDDPLVDKYTTDFHWDV